MTYHARRRPSMPGHTTHKNCANCLPYAPNWRAKVLAGLPERSPASIPAPV